MARKSGDDSNSKNSFNDVIGIALLTLALVLLVAQLSFDSLLKSSYQAIKAADPQALVISAGVW